MQHRRTRRVRTAPPRGGGAPLPAILAVAGVAVAAVIFVIVSRAGPEAPADAAPAVTQAPSKRPPDPHEEKRNEARWWFDETFFDAMGRAKALDGAQVDRLIAQGVERGYRDVPGFDWEDRCRNVYKFLLDREPFHPAANRAQGRTPLSDYPQFFDVFRRMQGAKALPPEMDEFRAKWEERIQTRPHLRTPALSPEEFAAASALLDRFQAWQKEMEADPTAKAIYEARARVKTDPLLGRYETVHVQMPPFVLFYASRDIVPRDDSTSEKERAAAERKRLTERLESYRRLIEDYLAFFRASWGEPLKLRGFEKDTLLFVWVFGDEKSWLEYGAACGALPTPGMVGYFSKRDHWVYLYEDKERVKVERSLAHELTHQLHWYHSEDPSSDFHNHFSRVKAVWFTEGWAEYAGSTSPSGTGYVFGQTSQHRVKSLRALRKIGVPLYPLKDLVKRESYEDWLRTALLEWLPKQRVQLQGVVRAEDLPGLFLEMLYAQSWLLFDFLYRYKDGRYKDRAVKFTAATLKGYDGHVGARGYAQAHEVFCEIMELRTNADWARLQKEYEEHLESRLYEVR